MPILSSIIDCLASSPLQPNAAIAYIQCTTPQPNFYCRLPTCMLKIYHSFALALLFIFVLVHRSRSVGCPSMAMTLLYFTHSRCMLIANPVTDASDTHVFPKSKRRWLREANPVSDQDKPIITSSSKQNITVFFLPRWHQIKRKYQLASAASTSEGIDN